MFRDVIYARATDVNKLRQTGKQTCFFTAIMPSCLAFGCTNTTGRTVEKSFYKIPNPKNEKARASRWLHNMGNARWTVNNFVASKDRVLCSDHFHPDCFKRDLKFELMPHLMKTKKRDFVPGAVPTIFPHKVYDEINMDGTKVVKKLSVSRKRTLELERSQVSKSHLDLFIFLIEM